MSTTEKSINVIHNCERHFYEWLKLRLYKKGIILNNQDDLSIVLSQHENSLDELKQHLKPLLKWDKIKNECYVLSASLNGSADNDGYFVGLIEKAAFEGQILWLTLEED